MDLHAHGVFWTVSHGVVWDVPYSFGLGSLVETGTDVHFWSPHLFPGKLADLFEHRRSTLLGTHHSWMGLRMLIVYFHVTTFFVGAIL